MDILEKVLATFNIPAVAREVYIDLVEHGGAPARLIATRLSMTRPSVYDQLKILMKFGLVVEKDRDGKTIFPIIMRWATCRNTVAIPFDVLQFRQEGIKIHLDPPVRNWIDLGTPTW